MEKENNELEKSGNKLTSKQKELVVTIVVLIFAIVIGFFIGKWLFEVLHR